MPRTIQISKDLSLSPHTKDDISGWLTYLNDRALYRGTLMIPYPYRKADALAFLRLNQGLKARHGREMNFAIRDSQGRMIGGIGFQGKYGKGSHKDEIGYWLGRPYRGRGIMTAVLKRFCSFAFEERKLSRIEATIFPFNIASMRLVERCGFRLEGRLRKAYLKNGRYIDGMLYAKVR
ncbi:MAG: GNAT family protein [Bacteroidota bacterium]